MRDNSPVAFRLVALYDYGPIAWFWRVFIAGFVLGGIVTLLYAIAARSLALSLFSLILLAPSLFFGLSVAVKATELPEGRLLISTLLFWRRRLSASQLGQARLRTTYENETGTIMAPRVWIPVRGGVPIYFDLLATIPDRRAFAKTFRLSLSQIPKSSSAGNEIENG